MAKHYPVSNFRIEIDGMPTGYFTKVEGIGSEHELPGASSDFFTEIGGIGSENQAPLPGRVKFDSITLKKGYIAGDPFGHKVNPGSAMHKVNPDPAMHKVNPDPAMHKVNPGSAMHKINPGSAMHKINPGSAMHKVNPDPATHKVNPDPAMHKVNPGSAMHKVNPGSAMHKITPEPASHKVNPGSAIPVKAAGLLVLYGFILDEDRKHVLQHWVDPGAPRKTTPRGQIVMLDASGRPGRRWEFFEAWPCKWYVPELDSDSSSSSDGATVEISVSRLIRV